MIVADNGSTDDSAEVVSRDFPTVELLLLGSNLGFCEGYNQALAQVSDSRYFVLLNSDVAVRPGWLPPLRALLENNPRKLPPPSPKSWPRPTRACLNTPGRGAAIWTSWRFRFAEGGSFDTLETDHGQYDDPRPVAWASGACCLVRASAWRELGGLEPAFFAHMEEIDFCWRLQNAGPRGVVRGRAERGSEHVGGGTLPASSPRKTYLNFRNGLALLYKNAAPAELTSAMVQRVLAGLGSGAAVFADGPSWPLCRAVIACPLARVAAAGLLAGTARRRRRPHLRVAERAGTYPGSVVWAYFGRGRRRFSDVVSE